MHDDVRQAAPDYTQAFLTTFGMLLFVVLFVIWAGWGLLAAMGAGWAADAAMSRIQNRG